jgi:hypothetical protein
MTDQPSAKALILARLDAAPTSPEPDAPAVGANQRHANPTLLSAASEYVQPLRRPDASTLANVSGGYYGRTDARPGNQVDISQIPKTLNAVGEDTRTSPAGASESVGG